ncbi:MAG: hypothetical protein IKS81_02815 [Verrucomicrobia bacterium]|nr:hypothetical protein [Verrucomicrobiota bacterium]MBR6464207.1 hypothetical protein [Verrucomicrobiota bacterium]
MMVSVMMTIIIYGLYSMFNQTQKSFRSNNAQVDVMTTGRMALDVITRDIELLAACNTENGANFLTLLSYPYDYPSTRYDRSLPMIQATVPGDTNGPYRTNFMQDMFFLQKQSNCWVPCAYFVGDTTIVTNNRATNAVYQVNSNGIGGLYRMGFSKLNELGESEPSTEYSTNTAYGWIQQFRGIDDGAARGYYHTNANLLAEGVVHFSIKCYDSAGQYIEYTNYYRPNVSDWNRVYWDSAGIRRTNGTPQSGFNIYTKIPNPDLKMDDLVENYLDYAGTWRINSKLLFPTNDVDMATNLVILGQMIGTGTRSVVTDNLFMSNAIPSYIEIELGLLEPQAIERVKAIGNLDARRQYLLRNSGQVHLFRKRIPVRMALQ